MVDRKGVKSLINIKKKKMIDKDDRIRLNARIANLKAEISEIEKKPKTVYNLHWLEVDRRLLRDAENALETGKMPEYKKVLRT